MRTDDPPETISGVVVAKTAVFALPVGAGTVYLVTEYLKSEAHRAAVRAGTAQPEEHRMFLTAEMALAVATDLTRAAELAIAQRENTSSTN